MGSENAMNRFSIHKNKYGYYAFLDDLELKNVLAYKIESVGDGPPKLIVEMHVSCFDVIPVKENF